MVKKLVFTGMIACLLLTSGRLAAQIAPNGWIQTQGWNHLFPVLNPFGANPGPANMKLPWLAPIDVGDTSFNPRFGDEHGAGEAWPAIDFGGASPSPGFNNGGITTNPIWVTEAFLADPGVFGGIPGYSLPSGDLVNYQDMAVHISNVVSPAVGAGALPNDNVMSVATTYVENTTGAAITVDVCTASDDSIQVWVNNKCVTNVAAARGSAGDCQERNPAILPPGVSKITALVWEGGGGWNFRLALERGGAKVTDGDADIVFLGAGVPGDDLTGQDQYLLDREGVSNAFDCPQSEFGVRLVGSGPGDGADVLTLIEEIRGTGASVTGITNDGDIEPITEPDDGIRPDTGAVLEFFVLGPIANPGGSAPGVDGIRAEYLSIPDSDVNTLTEGQMVNDRDGTAQTVRRLAINNGDGLDFNLVGGAGDNIMHYAWTQLTVTEPTDIVVGVGSDDSVQVLVNNQEVILHNGGRGWGSQGQAQNVSENQCAISLTAGTHTILTKTFEGGGGHGVRLLLYGVPSGGVGPGGADCASATPIAPGEYGVGCTVGGSVGTDCDPQNSPANYYVVEGTGETMTAQTCSGIYAYDTYVAVFAGTCDEAGCVGANDDSCGRQSSISWDSVAGTMYFVRVYGWDTSQGTYVLKVSDANTPPADVATKPLAGASVCADPDGDCDPEALAIFGQTITWEVTRDELGEGVGYTVAGDSTLTLTGGIPGEALSGSTSLSFPAQSGPIGPFDNSHDIGTVRFTGSTTDNGDGSFTVAGSGGDIWSSGMNGHFAYKAVSGDFVATVRIIDAQVPVPTGRHGRYGLMLRNSCRPADRWEFAMHETGGGDRFPNFQLHPCDGNCIDDSQRVDNGTLPGFPNGVGGDPQRPHWLRIVRRGKAAYGFMAFADPDTGDPIKWCQVGSSVDPNRPASALIGLAVGSHGSQNNQELIRITYDNFSCVPLAAPEALACVGAETLQTLAYDDAGDIGVVVQRGGGFTPAVVGGRLRITEENIGSSATNVWYGVPAEPLIGGVPLAEQGFKAEFDAYMTRAGVREDPAADPADGFGFSVIATGANDGLATAVAPFPPGLDVGSLGGDGGGAQGWAGGTIRQRTECHPGFHVEMDNWVGGGNNEPGDGGSPGNDGNWHLGVDLGGYVDSLQTNVDFGVPTGDLPDIFSPDGVHVEVVYQSSGKLDVWATANDGSVGRTKVLSTAIVPLPSGDLIVGFSGGTGGATSTQEVDNFSVSTLCCENEDSVSIAGPGTGTTEANTVLTASFGGADGMVSYSWSIVSGPGSIVGAADGESVEISCDAAGTVVVSVTASDELCGNEVSANHTLECACPEQGDTECDEVTVTPADITEGDMVTATASAIDASGDAIIYTFEFTDPGGTVTTVGPQASNSATIVAGVPGPWNVTVTVDDDPDCDDPPGTCTAPFTVDPRGFYRIPGDCNSDTIIDIADAACAANLIFGSSQAIEGPCGGNDPNSPANSAVLNVNGQGNVNVADVVHILNFLFTGEAVPNVLLGPCEVPPAPGDPSNRVCDETGCVLVPECLPEVHTCEP